MKLGEEILRCQPFAYVVSRALNTIVCDGCLSRASKKSFQRCSGCKYIYYCSPSCQRSCWPQHRDECKYLKAVSPKIPTDTVRLMARIVLKLQSGGSREVTTLPNGSKRCFDDLMSHQREIVRDSNRIEAFGSFFSVLQECLGDSLPPKPEVLEIYGRILVNSFNIMDEEYQPLGIGLYLSASALDHSCEPTANVIFKGKELIVRNIQEGFDQDFSGVRISYTNLINTNQTRKKELMDQYYFECTCPACQNDLSETNLLKLGAILCPKCSEAISTHLRPESCPKCIESVPDCFYEAHAQISQQLREVVFGNKGQHPDPKEQCTEFYPEMSKIFSPCDRNFVEVLETFYEQTIATENWELALDLGLKLLMGYRRLYPVYDVNTALMLMKIGKLACYLNKLSDAEKYLDQAEKIIAVTHGRGHPIFTGTLDPLIQEIQGPML